MINVDDSLLVVANFFVTGSKTNGIRFACLDKIRNSTEFVVVPRGRDQNQNEMFKLLLTTQTSNSTVIDSNHGQRLF